MQIVPIHHWHAKNRIPRIPLHLVSGPWTSIVAALDGGRSNIAVCRRHRDPLKSSLWDPCYFLCPYCVGGPVVAFISAVACVPAVVAVMLLRSYLLLLVADVTTVACIPAVAGIAAVAEVTGS